MLICWCIGKAASQVEEFYILPEQGKLYQYDRLAINVIVNNRVGGINSCDIPVSRDVAQFNKDYQMLTQKTSDTCESIFLGRCDDSRHIGYGDTELDCIVNQYTDKFCNPMVMWGKYCQHWFKTMLPISSQFHHVQMDGGQGARVLELLQKEMNNC